MVTNMIASFGNSGEWKPWVFYASNERYGILYP
jgi:hypothetical protein